MTKKPLLPITSPVYLRRLVRDLCFLPDGFYYNAIRCVDAKHTRQNEIAVKTLSGTWITVSNLGTAFFTTANGRGVFASRQA